MDPLSLADDGLQIAGLMPPNPQPGQKRRFLIFGLLNITITNAFLQVLLAAGLATGLATLLSQLCNVVLGYVLYGTQVFRVQRLQRRSAFAYGLLALVLWGGNWAGIHGLAQLGWSRQLGALLLIAPLAAVSYVAQKWLVFANPTGRGSTSFLHIRR